MADPRERLEKMIRALKDKGHRLTPQRLAMLKVIAQSAGHPGVEQIYEQIKGDFPTTSLATVYKTVSLLKEMGEVLELSFAHMGSRYDGNKPYPHPHVICTRCGRILDPDFTAAAEISQEMARQTGYQITYHQLNFFGLCPKCQQGGSQPESRREND